MLLELTFSALSALGLLSPMAEADQLAADARFQAAGGPSIPVKAGLPAGAKASLESRIGRAVVRQSLSNEPGSRPNRSDTAFGKDGERRLQPSFFSGATCSGAVANSAAAPDSAIQAQAPAHVTGRDPRRHSHSSEYELRSGAVCAVAELRPFQSVFREARKLDRGAWSNSRQRLAGSSAADGSAVDRRSALSAPVASGLVLRHAMPLQLPASEESERLPGPSASSSANVRGV